MQYNPKLKKAMKEIKEIIDKHDIAASVVLHTPGHGEHFMKIDPSYSCSFFDHTPGVTGIRFRSRLQEDFGGDAAKRNQAQEDTVNMFHTLTTLGGNQVMMQIETMKMLEKHFDINHSGDGHSSIPEQDN